MKLWEMVKSLEEKIEKPKRAEYLWVIECEKYGETRYFGLSCSKSWALEWLRSVNGIAQNARVVRFKRDGRD